MPYMQLARSQPAPRSPLLRLIPERGMGQDGSVDTIVDPSTGITYDLSGNVVTPQPIVSMPSVTPTDTFSSWFNSLSAPSTSTSASTVGTPVSTSTPSSGGLNLANLFSAITNAAIAGQKIYLTAEGPSLVPGTNAIYNPATGQYYNPTTGQVVNAPGVTGGSSTLFPAGLSTANLGPILLFAGLALGAVLLIGAIGKH